MSNSSLICCKYISPNKNSPRKYAIDSVAIHVTAGKGTVEGTGKRFQNPEVAASSNYGIDSDGRIGLFVDEADRAWCTSNGGVDNRAIAIEVANTELKDPWPVSDKAYSSLIALLVDICRRNNIPGLHWMADKDYGIAASKGGPVDKQNMFAHRWFANKACPGDYLYSRFGAIAETVNNHLLLNTPLDKIADIVVSPGNVDVVEPSTGGTPSTNLGSYQEDGFLMPYWTPLYQIDVSQIKPYIVTLDRNVSVTSASLTSMKSSGVIGAMVEAGYLYTSTTHIKVQNFRNPKAHDQVMLLNSLDIPHAFYMAARAKTIDEVRLEMSELSYLVRTLPPALGVWLKLDFPLTSAAMNDIFLNRYYDRLIYFGLKGKIGLITNDKTIKRINWSKHQENWLMMFENDITSLDEITGVLDPTFFDLEGRYT